MALTDKLDSAWIALTQHQDASRAKALLQNLRNVILETNTEIQAIVDEGSFTTLDTEIKDALVAAWNVSKAAQTAMEDATITELLDWSPSDGG